MVSLCPILFIKMLFPMFINNLYFFIAPSGSPRNLNASVLNSTAVYLVWNPPLLHEQNGVIKKYIVSVYKAVNDVFREADAYTTSIVIGELRPHYEYQISVSAFTVASGPDALVSVTTEEDGKKCNALVTNLFQISLQILYKIHVGN